MSRECPVSATLCGGDGRAIMPEVDAVKPPKHTGGGGGVQLPAAQRGERAVEEQR